jgi:YVTN family beta-propeller protein
LIRVREVTAALGAVAILTLVPASAQARSLYVPDESGHVSVINTATNTVTSTISLSGDPWVAAITPNGRTVYVLQYVNDTLTPISVSGGAVGSPITITGASAPYDLAITPNGSMAYVANYGTGTITPIDLTTATSGSPISVGDSSSETYAVTISPDGKTVYASNYATSQVVPVDTATGTAGTPISVSGAYYSAITPNGKTLWVVAYDAHELVPINTATGVAGTGIVIPGGTDLEGISISPDGTMAYVNDGNAAEVFPVNLSTRSVGLPIPTGAGSYPYLITMTPDGKTVYTADYDAGSVTPISTATNTPGTPVTVGTNPGQPAVVPNQGPKAAFTHRAHRRKASFNGSKSSDSDGKVAIYAWNFGDGSKKTTKSAKVSHTYRHAGHYHVTLTVTDNEGCSNQLVFTGQTAYCNGTKAAQVKHTVVIVKAKTAKKGKKAPTFTG